MVCFEIMNKMVEKNTKNCRPKFGVFESTVVGFIRSLAVPSWQRCLDVSIDKILTVNFQIFLFYLLEFSCVKLSDNDPNVFLNSATTVKSVFLNESGDIVVYMKYHTNFKKKTSSLQ